MTAYSRSPLCKLIALNVPIQPRNRLSLPVSQVTNNGLKRNQDTRFENQRIWCRIRIRARNGDQEVNLQWIVAEVRVPGRLQIVQMGI